MPKRHLFIFLMMLSLITSAFGQSKPTVLNRCDAGKVKPQLVIQTEENDYVINNSLSSQTLNRKSTGNFSGEFVVGLTTLKSKTIIDLDGPVWQDKATGGECFAPRITIKLIYEPMDVFIGNEFKKDSCSYQAILAHEMEHVRLYQVNLPKVEKIIKDLLNKRLAGRPVYAPSGQARAQFEKEIDEMWRPLIKSELGKIQIEQNALDSDEALENLGWSCLGEIQNLFGFRSH